jgi:Ca2+-binding RTX toxin-like protein
MANISGSGGGNLLIGTPDDDNIRGLGGNDILFGGEGDDDLFGGDSPAGGNSVGGFIGGAVGSFAGGLAGLAAGGPFGEIVGGALGGALGRAIGGSFGDGDNDDVLLGAGGNDDLSGDSGDDLLTGGDGNDRLDGGIGADILEGGTDADTFVFVAFGLPRISLLSAFFNDDTILDFSREAGDRIIVDGSNPATAESRVDNSPNDNVINDLDRNVLLRDASQTGVPDSLRLDFGGADTLAVVGVTSLTVNQDIFFV